MSQNEAVKAQIDLIRVVFSTLLVACIGLISFFFINLEKISLG